MLFEKHTIFRKAIVVVVVVVVVAAAVVVVVVNHPKLTSNQLY